MKVSMSHRKTKAVGLLVSLLLIALVSTVQAATSTASLSYESSKTGASIPVHDGGTTVHMSNESRSTAVLESNVRKHIAIFPDPSVYFQPVQPGRGYSQPIGLSASNYYAQATSLNKIYARVNFSD